MQINGYMIKEAIRSFERKRDEIVFDFSYTPVLKQNAETNKYFLDDSAKHSQEEKIRESMQLIAAIDAAIISLRKIQRAYNEYVGIFALLDEQSNCTRKITLLTTAANAGRYADATKVNQQVINQLNLGFVPKEKGVAVGLQFLDFSAELKALQSRQEKIKNKIGTKNAQMMEITSNTELFAGCEQ